MADKDPSGGAGGTVKLSFDAARLYAAEVIAKRNKVHLQEIKASAANISKEAVSSLRTRLKEVRDAKRSTLEKLRTQKDLVLQRARSGVTDGDEDAGGLTELARTLRKGRKGFLDFVGNPLRDVAAGNPVGAVLGLAGELGGPLVKFLVALVTAQVVAAVDERIKQEIETEVESFAARLEEERYQGDYQRRLEEEPDFRRDEARRASAETNRDEERLRAQGWGRSADFLDGL